MKGKISFIQILLIFVLGICAVTVYDNISDKETEKKEIDTIIAESVTPVPETDKVTDTETRISRIKEMHAINSDTVGWINIDGTAIDYPVLYNSRSNAYYLHRDINKNYSSSGIPFLDYQCKPDGSSDNTIIYAHNMRNGTMFHDLLNYANVDFYSTHKTVRFDTLSGIGEYEIFSVLRTKVGGKNEFRYYDFTDAKTPAQFDEFIAMCLKQSVHKSDIIPQYGDKILTLSTCSYNTDNERFVVFAKKIN